MGSIIDMLAARGSVGMPFFVGDWTADLASRVDIMIQADRNAKSARLPSRLRKGLLAFVLTALMAWSLNHQASTVTAAGTTLNLSHDLVSFGIASQNLAPDTPTLDAAPLLLAGLNYAQSHHYAFVTLDHGAYYLLTTPTSGVYLNLIQFADMTIDLSGSTLYLKEPFMTGLVLADSARVTLTNFQIDYLELPYTQVKLTSVNTAARQLFYDPIPGWIDPTILGSAPGVDQTFEWWVLAFRNGSIVPGTSRMLMAAPGTTGLVNLLQNGMPWAQPSTLATLQPGDTLVVAPRSGGSPFVLARGDSLVASHISIYGSSTWAAIFDQLSNSTADDVKVLPKPGTDRLLGSNADGIHFSTSGPNNHVRHCYVTRTDDDAIAIDSQVIGTVLTTTGARQLHVRRNAALRFPNGTPVTFVDPASTLEVFDAVIVSQNPPDTVQPVNFGEVDLEFDRDLPSLPAGTFFVFGTDSLRGAGSTIEDNVVEDIPGGRGIWLTGVRGVAVSRNRVGHTSQAGIIVAQDTFAFPGPPSRDIVIESNILIGSLGPSSQSTGTQGAMAAIQVTSTDNSPFAFAHTMPNHNVVIRNNFIADSGRGGIWIGELDGGTVENNVIVRWNRHPELPIWGLNSADRTMALADFPTPIGVRYSANVNATDNTTQLDSTISGAVNLAPHTAQFSKSAATAGVSVQANVSGLSWTASSDATWLTVTAGQSGLGDGNIQYSVAANASGAVRTGTILVAGVAFPVTQSSSDLVPSIMALDKTSLRFGVVVSGGAFAAQTPAQTVRITQSGTTPVAWIATPTQSWITVTPSSGSGSAMISVGVAASSNIPGSGSVAGAINMSFIGASNSAGAIEVTATLVTAASAAAPFGSFDTPSNGITGVAGSIAVTGWALDDVAVTRVTLCRDAVSGETAPADPNCAGNALIYVGDAVFVDGARPDVQAGFSTLPFNSRAGWGYLLLSNFLPGLGNGTFNLRAFAFDADGHSTALGVKTITCDNANASAPFGAIDQPVQGATVGGVVGNVGWILTKGPNHADPPSGGNVNVFIDGTNVGSPGAWNHRSDLDALFPASAYPGIGNALGIYGLDTTTLANGVHTIFWVATGTAASGTSGIGSRFFTVSNGSVLADPASAENALNHALVIDARTTLEMPQAVAARVASPLALTLEVAAAPADLSAIHGRRGFDLDRALQMYTPSGRRVDVQAEELDRVELQLSASASHHYSGYLQTVSGLRPLPIGSTLDSSTGLFTWTPGVGFYGPYDLTFVRWSGGRAIARQDVRITLNAKGSNRIGPQTIIDAPGVGRVFRPGEAIFISGWAADLDAPSDHGVSTVHVWAYPVDANGTRQDPTFLGQAIFGVARADVAALYGDRFLDSGYGILVNDLAPGTYDIAVFAYSTVVNNFTPAKVVRVVVR